MEVLINMAELLVKFWDVKHGHATYLKSPNGRHIVVDLGIGAYSDSNETFSPILHLKDNYGMETIDYCIITHPHMDHIDDIENFSSFSPKVFNRPKNIKDEDLLKDARESEIPKIEKYLEICHSYNKSIDSNDYNNTSNSENWGGLKINSFRAKNCSTSNLNNQSSVTIFEYATSKIVIPGDNESASWNELLQNEEFVDAIKDADIYLASHHGRESGYHDEIINIINPRLTIVSDSRFHENSVIDKYGRKSRGWSVYKGDQVIKRNTLSTYNDGVITVKAGYNPNGKAFLQVNI